MAKIETADDVRQWARAIVAANGEKFTALSKGEQFTIAKFIVATEVNEGDANDADAPKPREWKGESSQDCQVPQEDEAQERGISPVTTATMTRAYAYHRAQYSAQQAYDEFLKWAADHPKETSVMDFSTGAKSQVAAFAYWLGETISIDIPKGAV